MSTESTIGQESPTPGHRRSKTAFIKAFVSTNKNHKKSHSIHNGDQNSHPLNLYMSSINSAPQLPPIELGSLPTLDLGLAPPLAPFVQEDRKTRILKKKKSLSSLSFSSLKSKKEKDTNNTNPPSPVRSSMDIKNKLRDLKFSNRETGNASQRENRSHKPSKSRSAIDIAILRRKKPENKENFGPHEFSTPSSIGRLDMEFRNQIDVFDGPSLEPEPSKDYIGAKNQLTESIDTVSRVSPSKKLAPRKSSESTRKTVDSYINSLRRRDVDDLANKYTSTGYTPASQRDFFQHYEPARDVSPDKPKKPRPKSSYLPSTTFHTSVSISSSRKSLEHNGLSDRPLPAHHSGQKGSVKCSKSSVHSDRPAGLDLVGIDEAFEALLESRGVAENMKDKMRGLDIRVKQEFIHKERQMQKSASEKDFASISVSNNGIPSLGFFGRRPRTAHGGDSEKRPKSMGKDGSELPTDLSKRSRPRSRTFGASKDKVLTPNTPSSPIKRRKDNRCDLAPSTTSAIPTQCPPSPTMIPSFTPEEWVHWLKGAGHRRNFGPQIYAEVLSEKSSLEKDMKDVNIPILHKLRLVIRNESLRWVECFLKLDGMGAVWALVERVLCVEWREEHEDNIFHELLLCLKGLCTASLAQQNLASMAPLIFPRLLELLFDEEHKGPSEFGTRGLITNLLFVYLSSSATSQKPLRTRRILGYLSDKKDSKKRPLEFLDVAHTSRPYKRWCKEVVNVTKEVFWIFLHGSNVVPVLPANSASLSYSERNFPSERPPVPAAAHVGGVEWEATTYLATHLDLLNGCIASLATREERNDLRLDLKNSGWERAMGSALRTCKEKFHGNVHGGLKTWVRAAIEDEWYVGDVRFGPRLVSTTRPSSPVKRRDEAPPKLELHIGSDNIKKNITQSTNPELLGQWDYDG